MHCLNFVVCTSPLSSQAFSTGFCAIGLSRMVAAGAAGEQEQASHRRTLHGTIAMLSPSSSILTPP